MSLVAVARLRHPALLDISFQDGPLPQLLSPLVPGTPLGSPTVSGTSTPLETPTSPLSPTRPNGGPKKPKPKKKASGANAGPSVPRLAHAGPHAPTPEGASHPLPKPIPSYALLRNAHATALKLSIARLRRDQWASGYLRTPEHLSGPWQEYDYQVSKLEEELALVRVAQAGLDRFPNCHAPTQALAEHGPQTREERDKAYERKVAEARKLNIKLDEEFPFLRQCFVGPMTRRQARHDAEAREMIRERDIDDIEMLLEEPNKVLFAKWLKDLQNKPGGKKRKTFEEARMEREEKRVREMLREAAAKAEQKQKEEEKGDKGVKERPKDAKGAEESKTKHEGAKEKEKKQDEQLLVQREQRHAILTWLRQPWGAYDADAAALIKQLGQVAVRRLTEAGARRGSKVGEKDVEISKAMGKEEETEQGKRKTDAKAGKKVKGAEQEKEKEREKEAPNNDGKDGEIHKQETDAHS